MVILARTGHVRPINRSQMVHAAYEMSERRALPVWSVIQKKRDRAY